MTTQDDIFASGEGDLWFSRNRAKLEPGRLDPVMDLVPAMANGAALCEAGCANGWRLATLARKSPGARFVGFDLSAAAIHAGQNAWPHLELHVGPLDSPPIVECFDVLVVSFVLHWVDRSLLARSVAALDGLLAYDGRLVLADFYPDSPCARPYHHRTDVVLNTYKQDYAACFLSLGTYELERSVIYHHSEPTRRDDIDEQDRARCVVLHKSLGGYRNV